jgi:hypothetical protein
VGVARTVVVDEAEKGVEGEELSEGEAEAEAEGDCEALEAVAQPLAAGEVLAETLA